MAETNILELFVKYKIIVSNVKISKTTSILINI